VSRPTETEPPPIAWLLERSKSRLYEFRLKQLNKAANSRKELLSVAQQWVEERALELLTTWLIEYGEELIVLASEPRKSPQEIREEEKKPDALPVAKPKRFEFWRHGERRFTSRRRAG